MIKNVIALYPGRFQPFGKHHASAFKWLQQKFGAANAYIVTSDKVEPPKSPFSFQDKQDIISHYGYDDRLVQVKNPYKAEEILAKLNPADTAVVFMVGAKDMKEDPRFTMKPKKDGSPSYFQPFEANKTNLQGFNKHGYLIVAPHQSLNIPGYGEMSGTSLRNALSSNKPKSEKIELFKSVFGWYDEKTADMIFKKLQVSESTLFSKDWWTEALDLTEEDPCWTGYKQIGMKKKGKKQVPNCVPANEGYMSAPMDIENLNEIGEATASKYKWEETDREGYFIYVEFETESETTYFVDLGTDKYKGVPVFNVEFAARTKGERGSSSKVVVNKGEMYKVMATITDVIKTYLMKFKKVKGIIYYPSKKGNEAFGTQRDKLYKAFITKAIPGIKFEPINNVLYDDGIVALMPDAIVAEGYMSAKVQAKHNAKIEKLKQYLRSHIGQEFVYNFDEFPKTVFGVKIQDLQEQLLKEGGSGGHMSHPFDIDWVTTGKDLLEVFQKSIEYLKKGPAAVKIDGVNASIRLITLDGKKTFVMDRGSNKPLDVKGITKAELTDRFGEGHGMIKIGGTVLDIFNEAIPDITSELIKLKLWNNPNIMFNIEYVAGSTNVLSYDRNFLAIHGLLEIEQVTPTRRGTKEISYSEPTLQDLLNKLQPTASKYGYQVLGSVPTELKGTPNLVGELSKQYTVDFGNRKETKSLSQWLASTKIPKDEKVKTSNGKVIAALSKEVLLKLSEETPLPEFLEDAKYYQDAINGYITYLATMKLGDAILEKLSSPLGPVSEHEGIVIRDPDISTKPFKLTGKFILGGLASSFKK
jgi:hypothetical protein